MTTKQIYLVVMTTFLVAISLGAARQNGKQDEAATLSLMQEREKVLQALVDLERQKFELGESTLENIIDAERELLEAKLESATTKQERIAIREAALKLARERELRVSRRVEQGDLSPGSVLRAKADRLRADIDLHLERRQP